MRIQEGLRQVVYKEGDSVSRILENQRILDEFLLVLFVSFPESESSQIQQVFMVRMQGEIMFCIQLDNSRDMRVQDLVI